MDYAILSAEVNSDPLGRGYAGMSDDAAAADLNTEYRSRNVQSVTGQAIFEAITQTDFTGLSDAQKSLLYAIIGMGEILVNGTNTKEALLAMFGPDTDTRANLAVLQKQACSRAEELGLPQVSAGNISSARN